jgi:hypothetical protein
MSSFHDEEIVDSSPESTTMEVDNVPSNEDSFNLQYDLAAENKERKRKGRKKGHPKKYNRKSSSLSFPVDPWETTSPDQRARSSGGEVFFPSTFSNGSDSIEIYDDDDFQDHQENDTDHQHRDANVSVRSTFLMPTDIHPRMEHRDDDIAQLRLLAGKLNADWGGQDFMAPALARRIRDFQFAQEKRRKKYGDERPWGILGLYDHLASIR